MNPPTHPPHPSHQPHSPSTPSASLDESGAVAPFSPLVVAVSSRALFNFEEENRIFDSEGPDPYRKLQQERMEVAAAPGVAFPLVEKLLALKDRENNPLAEVAVLSRNDPVTGLRVFRSAAEHRLSAIKRAVFTRGAEPFPYLKALGAHLFLSAHPEDVREAIALKIPAATIHNPEREKMPEGNPRAQSELRIAFDGDAVLFGDHSERTYKEKGLNAFREEEKYLSQHPLEPGPFQPFLKALHDLRNRLPEASPVQVRIALVTARGAPAHERPIRTMMQWGVEVDETFFLDGAGKGKFLDAFRPDFFFDDQKKHIHDAESVASGHVPYGVRNPAPDSKTDSDSKPDSETENESVR